MVADRQRELAIRDGRKRVISNGQARHNVGSEKLASGSRLSMESRKQLGSNNASGPGRPVGQKGGMPLRSPVTATGKKVSQTDANSYAVAAGAHKSMSSIQQPGMRKPPPSQLQSGMHRPLQSGGLGPHQSGSQRPQQSSTQRPQQSSTPRPQQSGSQRPQSGSQRPQESGVQRLASGMQRTSKPGGQRPASSHMQSSSLSKSTPVQRNEYQQSNKSKVAPNYSRDEVSVVLCEDNSFDM